MPARGQLRGRAGGCYRGETHRGREAEGTAGWARDGRRASAGTGGMVGGRGGDTGAGAVGVGGMRAPPAARAARREAQRLLAASRSRPPRQPPAPPLLLACEARLVRARPVALSGDTCAAAHSRPPPRTRSASSPQPASLAPNGPAPCGAHAHSAAPCRPYLRAPLGRLSAGANRRGRSTPGCRNGPVERSSSSPASMKKEKSRE